VTVSFSNPVIWAVLASHPSTIPRSSRDTGFPLFHLALELTFFPLRRSFVPSIFSLLGSPLHPPRFRISGFPFFSPFRFVVHSYTWTFPPPPSPCQIPLFLLGWCPLSPTCTLTMLAGNLNIHLTNSSSISFHDLTWGPLSPVFVPFPQDVDGFF